MPPGQKRPRRNFEQVFVVPPGPIAPRLVDDLPEACPARPSPARTRIRIAHVNALRTDCFRGRKINPSDAFAGQNAGVTQVGERVWLVSFNAVRSRLLRGRNHPGRADRESLRPESIAYVLGINRHPCDRNRPDSSGVPNWNEQLLRARRFGTAPRCVGHSLPGSQRDARDFEWSLISSAPARSPSRSPCLRSPAAAGPTEPAECHPRYRRGGHAAATRDRR
jgi:hypothetical protein